MAARLPASLGEWAVARTTRRRSRQVPRDRERDADQDDPDGQDEAVHEGEDQLVDDPVGRSAVEVGEVAGGEGGDLLALVVLAPDRIEQLRERPHDPARDERLERHVEIARGDVLVEVVGEEQHRAAEGRVLEHDRGIVGDDQVDREQQVVDVDPGGRSVEEPVAERLGDRQRLLHERVHLDDHHRIALDAQRVEGGVVEMLEAVGGVADRLAAIGRREQDRLAADDLGERGACRLDAGRPCLLVEEAVHPRDPGRHDALLRDPERLGVERHVELGADDRGRVVLVGPEERIEVAGLAGPAVADGLERARGVPQLDDPHVLVQLDPVERRERVVEQDHVGPGERAGQAKAVAERPALGDPGLEHGHAARSRGPGRARPSDR